MEINFTEQERDYLVDLLEVTRSDEQHELHYTDATDYKRVLKDKLAVIDAVLGKLKAAGTVPADRS